MTLREKIELCIRAEGDPAKAATLIMGMIEMHGPGLAGNGWLADDTVLLTEDGRQDAFYDACKQAEALVAHSHSLVRTYTAEQMLAMPDRTDWVMVDKMGDENDAAKALVNWLDQNEIVLQDDMDAVVLVPAALLRDLRRFYSEGE